MTRMRICALLCGILVIASVAYAQTTGSIQGKITDVEGEPLPGVKVAIFSKALIIETRTAHTNELGVFRFPSLPIGTYSLEATLDGFETVRVEKIEVRLQSIANVPLIMQFASVAEDVTVIGDSQVLDVTRSGLATSYKNEMLREVPTQRWMWDLMAVSPGVTVDLGDSRYDRLVALGSSRHSNSWNIDGVDVSAPESGSAFWYVTPDLIEEVQVFSVGVPAEYGNHLGAVLNIVTKKGGNDTHGAVSYFFQTNDLTGTNVELENVPASECCFHRENFRNFSAQLGGPIKKDRVWYLGSFEYFRDASTEPGNDSAFTPETRSDKYDIKVSGLLGENHQMNGFFHYEDWDFPLAPTPVFEPSALGGASGTNPAWGGTLISTLSDSALLEITYAGWWGDIIYDSQTGSLEDPFIDYTPEDGRPIAYSGGVWYPWDVESSREQLKGKMTYYAENFLKSQHEFRFGVQFSKGSGDAIVGIGSNGTYTYNYYGYLYRAYMDPYQYGGRSTELGFFVDDTVTVTDSLTLNLGLRFDHNTGDIPDYDRLTIGQPSISTVGNFTPTGEKIPGVNNLINWNLLSPRIGFTFQPRADGRSVLHGSFGVYYDQNVIGNWEAPPPGLPTFRLFQLNEATGLFDILIDEVAAQDIGLNLDLKAPRTLQYSIGYDQQLSDDISIGVQYVYKDTKDLIGWEILGGAWEEVPFVDPFTGNRFGLLSQVEVPTLRKGNDPGDFPGSEGVGYFQKYHGLLLTFSKRFSERWGLNASYTLSKSTGLIPRMLSQEQFEVFAGSREGSDPNNYVNSEGRLQGDRPHMFRLQAVFLGLPWDLQASTSVEFSSGRAHNRQIRVGGLGQGTAVVIMEPGGSFRYSGIRNIDVSIGKRFYLTPDFQIRLEGWIYNLLNSDQELLFSSLELQNPQEFFSPELWVKPRRLQIRVGFQF